MKFIISESKFRDAIFHYLDSALDSIEFLGDYYFIEKGTDNVLIKTGDGYVIDWVEEKTKKTVLSRDITPYKQELPSFIKRKS